MARKKIEYSELYLADGGYGYIVYLGEEQISKDDERLTPVEAFELVSKDEWKVVMQRGETTYIVMRELTHEAYNDKLEQTIKEIADMPLVKGIGNLEDKYNSVVRKAQKVCEELLID